LPSRKFRRGREGRIEARLEVEEVDLLRHMADEMTQLLDDGAPDEVRERLFPLAYRDDAIKQAEYRRLMAGDLEERKRADMATLRATLDLTPITLDGDEARAWLFAIQDMRLTVGTLLGIEEDGWEAEEPPDDPQFAVLHYLGFLQDALVHAVG
jgi:hypothetical protein